MKQQFLFSNPFITTAFETQESTCWGVSTKKAQESSNIDFQDRVGLAG